MKPSHLDDIRGAKTEDALLGALIEAGGDLGFEFATMSIACRPMNSLPVGKSIHNFPDKWATATKNLAVALVDPVFVRVHQSSEPFFYDQSYYVDAGAGPLWEESAAHGIRAGVCGAMDLPGERRMYWGFDGGAALPKSSKTRIELLAATQLIGAVAVGAAKHLLSHDAQTALLTDTQIAMLRFTRDGQSSWEISRILNMSEDTVKYHLKKCRAKLGVATKHQAVHKALSLGLLG